MKNTLKNTVILLLITFVATLALSYVYQITKEPIAAAEQKKKAEAYQQVYTDAKSFDDVAGVDLATFNAARTDSSSVEEVLAANDASGNRLGYVMTVAAKGYGGDVRLALGIDKTGTVVGYAVLSHNESPGFGANCENEDIKQQFIGLTDADAIDGISGATYTTNALKWETEAALDIVKELEGTVK